ncbi:MAG: hypothetical protein WA705_26425 [Candidatus Ozemobacteraceae bacterium]
MKRKTHIYRSLSGFTLVEVLIGVGLLAFLLLIFLTVLRGGTRESTLSSDHFTSAMLSQKVVEDMIEEVDLNPLGMSALGIEDGSPLSPTSVVDGAAPFFKSIEDRTPPWGRIDGQKEGIIDSTYAPLFGQVKTFMVSATAKRPAVGVSFPENRHLIEAGIHFDWDARVGGGNQGASCYLFSPVGAKPASISFNFDQAQVEKEIATNFFDSPGVSLAQLTSESGANFQTVLCLGTIHYASQGFINSTVLKTYLDEVTLQKTKSAGPFGSKADEYKAKQALAKAYYDLANSCFLAVYVLATDVANLKNACSTADLGEVLSDNPTSFLTGLKNYRKIYITFLDSIDLSFRAYYELLTPALAGARGVKQQMFVIKRLLDLQRIQACDPTNSVALNQYKLFLEALRSEMEGRNPFLHRLLMQEKGFAQSVDMLVEKHPFLNRIKDVTVHAMPVAQGIITKYDTPSGSGGS